MPARHPVIRHRFAGGWAPDFGPTAEVAFEGGIVDVPWLTNADNLEYTLDGGVRKVGGTARLNSAELESGAKIMGLFDYWRQGSAGSPTQKRVLHVGTKIKKDDADGNFTDLFTGLSAGAIPDYAVFDDYLVIMSDVSGDVPKFWDQTTSKNLGMNTPDASFGVTHKNRFWMAGDASNPSRLYYSQALPDGADGNWTGAGAGSLNIDPGDGDRITGLVSHKNELWVFKGPYTGSIHRITGSSESDFARTTFVRGLGAVAHRGIFRFQDDIGFVWADGSVHSLRATAAFGDFRESSLSLPINDWIRDHVNTTHLGKLDSTNIVGKGRVAITVPVDTSTENNLILLMDYRFTATERLPRWSPLPDFSAASLANVVDTASSDRPSLFSGGNDGFVRKNDQSNRSLDGITSYEGRATLPFLSYGNPMQMKTLETAAVGIAPKGNFEGQFCWTRDDHPQQCMTFSQGGGDVLAPASVDEFTLGTSVLGGARFVDRYLGIEEGGEFRSVQYEISQSGLDEGMELHTLSAALSPSGRSTEN